MIEGKMALDGATAGLNLLAALLAIAKEAKKKGSPLAIADVLERMPAEAYTLAGQLVHEIETLKQSLLDHKVDITKSIDQLEDDVGWWRLRQWRAIRAAGPKINAITTGFSGFLDDVVAIAQCREAEDVIATSYGLALTQKKALREKVRANLPLGSVLDTLRDEAEKLRAALGDLKKKE